MGTAIIIILSILAIADGFLLTRLAILNLPFLVRISAGAVIGLALLSWTGLLISLLFGLNVVSILLTAFCLVAGLIVLVRLKTWERLRAEFAPSIPNMAGVIYHALWMALLIFLYGKVVMFYPDGMHTAPANNYGDLPFHFSVVTSFAYGDNLPPQSPIFAGIRFTYPFLIDFLTAFFIRCGADWRSAFFVENILLAFSLVVLIEFLTLRLTSNNLAARIAPVIFLFNGGFGFVNFFSDLRSFFSNHDLAKRGLLIFLAHLPNTYTMNADLLINDAKVPLRWGNVFTTLLIPQRSMLFGLPFVAMIVILWGMWAEERGRDGETERRREGEKESEAANQVGNPSIPPSLRLSVSPSLLSAGILAGMLPMLHAHGFFAVMIAAAAIALLYWSRDWIAFFVPVAVLAGPQALWLSGTQVRNKLFEFHLWWDAGDSNPLIFWAVNAGLFISILTAALVAKRFVSSPSRRFYLPFLLWWIVPNVMLLAPWPWDNIKVLVYWSLISCPFVAAVIAYLFARRSILFSGIGVLFLGCLIFSGGLDVMRGLSPAENTPLFSADELRVAQLLRATTPSRSIILHAPIHNSAVVLSGRQSVIGYPGHLWTHGIDYEGRLADVTRVFAGGGETDESLARLNADYVLIGPEERSQLKVDEGYFERAYRKVIDYGGYRLYRLK